ncbi:stage II sporulation protein E [Clostridium sp. MB40-C1]|uniref:stage II sporulation protein E n=1 Tax=Clostridium sp. MB40-C1 TaxID=3070996 RepID=UPI0027DF6125|nr:stage II sporulation protein E [Clostridium sp. MB40-C1]WMJ80266.1 stage II sporulation protein E [Clostridium sp. MB40-C1]
MQYGADIFPYKRIRKTNKDKKNLKSIEQYDIFNSFAYFIICLLVSRVIMLNLENSMAPFGVAFLIVISLHKKEFFFISVCGTIAGYLSIYNKLSNLPGYLIIIGTIAISAYMLEEKSKNTKLLVIFCTIFSELIASEFWIKSLTFKVAFLFAFLQIISIIPVYFILERSIICINKFKTKHLFSSEEVISMTVVFALVISGTWGISIAKISIMNILALGFILILSYINGSTVGATSGIAIGAITGMCSNNILIYVSVYGLCGFFAGLFKDMGKWLTGTTYIITFLILILYSNIKSEFNFIEVIVASGAFVAIPNEFYTKLNLELDWEKKQEYLNKSIASNIKSLIVNRLDSFSEVLYGMSNTLEELSDNDKLLMKSKSSGLIENLADRVCSNCSMNTTCWKKEIYCTYAAFGELIQNYQEQRRKIMPKEIERKCIKRTLLLKNTQDIVNNYMVKEMWRERQSEGRKILSQQINSMADSFKEIMKEFNCDIKIDTDIEKKLRKILGDQNIKYEDIFCFENKNNRLVIKMTLKACGGTQLCVKKILPFINEVVGKLMCVSDEGCVINPKTSECNITFEEAPRYYIASYANKICKEGEKYSGDSYSFGKILQGNYMCIISDGMGSGPEAGRESKAAVDMVEKFINSGISKIKAVDAVNTIMTLRFPQEEKFSTLDLCDVDLYSGDVNFMKIGSVCSFIKSGTKVEVIRSKTLPIGVLDKVDVDVANKKVKNGDFIIMLSDGVVDYDIDNTGNIDWVLDYLQKNNTNNPKELVDGMINKAKELSGGKVRDDMTAIVSKVYSLY